MKPENRQKLMVATLAVLLLCALGYIGYDKWLAANLENLQAAANQGYAAGVRAALSEAYDQTKDCQITTITIGNASRQIVDLACVPKTK